MTLALESPLPRARRRRLILFLATLAALAGACGETHEAPADAAAPADTATDAAGPAAPALLVDSDMGLDDARVIVALPMQSSFHVVGIVTVEGSGGAVKGADNALRLLAAVGVDSIPVAVGATQTIEGVPIPTPAWRSMADGLGGVTLPPSSRLPEAVDGAAFIETALRQSAAPVWVLAIGPLTNVATVLARAPDLAAQVQSISAEGDFVGCTGYNCATDPAAADVVKASGVPIFMIGPAATNEAPFDAAFLADVAALDAPAAHLVAQFMASHSDGSMKLWDDTVLASVLHADLLTWQDDASGLRVTTDLDLTRLHGVLLGLWGQPSPIMP